VAQKDEIFARSNAPVSYRSRAEILRMFNGFNLVEPGLTAVTPGKGAQPYGRAAAPVRQRRSGEPVERSQVTNPAFSSRPRVT